MNIQVISETELQLTRFDLNEFHIEFDSDIQRYSAIAMFVTSLARCTFAVLAHFATRLDITTENISTHLTWDFIDDPTRINQINMVIVWPELPDKRIASVTRASHKCTISNTVKDCIKVNTSVFNDTTNAKDNF